MESHFKKSLWDNLKGIEPKKITQLQTNLFLLFYKYKHVLPTSGVGFEEAGLDKNDLAKFYWKMMLTREKGTGITKTVGTLTVDEFQKSVREGVVELLKKPVKLDAPAYVIGPKDWSEWLKVAEGNTNGWALMTVNVKSNMEKGFWESVEKSWIEWTTWSDLDKGLGKLKNPMNFQSTTGQFTTRIFGPIVRTGTDTAVKAEYKEAIEGGLEVIKQEISIVYW